MARRMALPRWRSNCRGEPALMRFTSSRMELGMHMIGTVSIFLMPWGMPLPPP